MYRAILLMSFLLSLPAETVRCEDEYRTWNMTSGRKTKIKLAAVGLIGSRVVFKREDDGRTFQFPVRNLTRDQQSLIRQMFLSPPNASTDNSLADARGLNPIDIDSDLWPAPKLTDQNLSRWANFIHPDNVDLINQQADPTALNVSVVIRDLPRGNVLRPGANVRQRTAHSLASLSLSADEAKSFANTAAAPQSVPRSVMLKLATIMKDNVRGPSPDWDIGDVKKGQLIVERRQTTDTGLVASRIRGTMLLKSAERSYRCQVLGHTVWNDKSQRFEQFTLVAAGQRSGGSEANSRAEDRGPAPMGVTFRLQGHAMPPKLDASDPNVINL